MIMVARKPRTTASSTVADENVESAENGVMLTAVPDTADDTVTAVKPKRVNRRRDLSVNGVGLVGGFSDADPDDLPLTGKNAQVDYLYDPLKDSYERDAWKATIVVDLDACERAVRLAASHLGIGVSIRSQPQEFVGDDGETVNGFKVFFRGKVKNSNGKTTPTE